MKKSFVFFLTLALVLTLFLGDLAVPELIARADVAAEEAHDTLAQLAEENVIQGRNKALRHLLAKSKKKKNTPEPTAAVTPAPAAEKTDPAFPEKEMTPTPVPEGPIIDPQSLADYLFSHQMQLPENYITKKEAQRLGWDSHANYVSDVAPGKSIGGDYFGNYEGRLPQGQGITYHEADCYYTKGKRNAYRVIYSSDGRVWYTEDHYNTFTELFPTIP